MQNILIRLPHTYTNLLPYNEQCLVLAQCQAFVAGVHTTSKTVHALVLGLYLRVMLLPLLLMTHQCHDKIALLAPNARTIWPLQKDTISIDAIAVDAAADQHPSLTHVLW